MNNKDNKALKPIIRWHGGKEKELPHIYDNIPEYERYFEPFVGGGSVFMALDAKEHYINDFSEELMDLYQAIADNDADFFAYTELIEDSWEKAKALCDNNPYLKEMYYHYERGEVGKSELEARMNTFCDHIQNGIHGIMDTALMASPGRLMENVKKSLYKKIIRTCMLNEVRDLVTDSGVSDNIETAVKGAVYTTYRELYNDRPTLMLNKSLCSALFLFIRNYCYSGMFRYNADGRFNVPYGGISYNKKTLRKKVGYYKSDAVRDHFANAHLYCMDFEKFLEQTAPTENDFIFLDPPYDSTFSTYSQNEFNRDDQKRLAEYLTGKCKAKWLMIIKKNDFIRGLYENKGLSITSFDKRYLVNFMGRNGGNVTHLVIKNY